MMPITERLRTALEDRYIIEREVGAGGMATVYLAHDIKLDREVAIKVLRSDLAAVLGVERFLAEVRIAARLDHPHILTLIDSGESDGLLYYVMPFVRGESLRARLVRERQMAVDEALNITRQIASALDYAHEKGIVHRDIKPENILLHEGEAILSDFGIAIAVKEAGDNRLTETGLSLGTPQYMSPEQATGDRSLDARSDVYSLAAVLYEMLCGEPPVTGATAQAMIAKLLTEKPTSIRVVRDTVTAGVDQAVMKALGKVPADRFRTAGEFSKALEIGASGAIEANVRQHSTRGNRMGVSVAVATVIALVAAGFGWRTWSNRAAPHIPVRLGERSQVTFSGHADAGAISDDGKTIALRTADCKPAGCTYGVDVHEIGGAAVRRLVEGLPTPIFGLRWSPDRRTIMYNGAARRSGITLVSQVGGAPVTFMRGAITNADFFGSDSIVSMGSDDTTSIQIAGLDGLMRDRIPVVDATEPWRPSDVMEVADSPWFIVALSSKKNAPEIYRVVDRHGHRSGADVPIAGYNVMEWASRDALWMLMRGVGRQFLLRYSFDRERGQLSSVADTVYAGTSTSFCVTRDGALVLLNEGSTTYDSWSLDVTDMLKGNFQAEHRIGSSTSELSDYISPDGKLVLLMHDGGSGRKFFSMKPSAGGAETPLRLSDAYVARWLNSETIEYAVRKGNDVLLGLFDVRTGLLHDTLSIRDPGVINTSNFTRVAPAGWAWLGKNNAVYTQQRNESSARRIPMPSSLETIYGLASTRDGNQLAVVGYLRMDSDTSAIMTMSPDGNSPVTWALERGDLTPILTDRPVAFFQWPLGVSTPSLFRLEAPQRTVSIGTATRPVIWMQSSGDLRHGVATTAEYHGDAYIMRVLRP